MLLIGAPDSSLAPDGLTYHRILQQTGMWLVHLTGLSVDDSSPTQSLCDLDRGHACVALLDTGTSFIGVPSRLYPDLVARITANRQDCVARSPSLLITCESHALDGLPSLSFTLSATHTYTLTPAEYMTGGTVGVMPLHTTREDSSVALFILGDTFIRAFLTVFDMDGGQIGIGNGKNVRTEGGEAQQGGWEWKVGLVLLSAVIVICAALLCWTRGRSRLSGGYGGGGGMRGTEHPVMV